METGRRRFLKMLGAAVLAPVVVAKIALEPVAKRVFGINLDMRPGWKNYTSEYVDVSKDDMIEKMQVALNRMKFQPPVDQENFWVPSC